MVFHSVWRLNKGFDLLFSTEKRVNHAGLSGVMLYMSVRFRQGDLGIFATWAIVASVVFKSWL